MILLLAWSNFTEIVFNENNASMKFFSISSSTWAVPFTDIPTPWLVNTFGVLQAQDFISDSISIILQMEIDEI